MRQLVFLTFSSWTVIFRPKVSRSEAEPYGTAQDLEAHLQFALICTPSSPAGSYPPHSAVKVFQGFRHMYDRGGAGSTAALDSDLDLPLLRRLPQSF